MQIFSTDGLWTVEWIEQHHIELIVMFNEGCLSVVENKVGETLVNDERSIESVAVLILFNEAVGDKCFTIHLAPDNDSFIENTWEEKLHRKILTS